MNGLRRFSTLLALLALALSPLPVAPSASSAEIEDELIKLPTEISATNTGVIFRNYIETFGESVLAARYPNQANGMFKSRPCTSSIYLIRLNRLMWSTWSRYVDW